MKTSKFTDEQIALALRQAEAGSSAPSAYPSSASSGSCARKTASSKDSSPT